MADMNPLHSGPEAISILALTLYDFQLTGRSKADRKRKANGNIEKPQGEV